MTVIGAFTTEDVAKLTKLSKRQIAYWDETNVYSPTIARGSPHQAHGRLYSFRDVVALRTLALIRQNVSLQEIRRVGLWLRKNYDSPWSRLSFYLFGDRILFGDPDTGEIISTLPAGQRVIPFELEAIAEDMSNRFHGLRQRDRSEIGRIERHRYVVRNDDVVAGTRIPTRAIWEYHLANRNTEAILAEFPDLVEDDVVAAIEFEQQRHAS